MRVANQLRVEGIKKDEADLVVKRLALDDEKNAALLEKDSTLRQSLLDLNREKFIALDAEEALFYEKKNARDLAEAEQKKELDAIAREEDVALNELYDAEDIQKLQTGTYCVSSLLRARCH